ncbi:MAG: hypothetical protein Q7R49_00205 [Candidatus Daviesbacteria bacterium]|nr:hypothetical protein [Candidatus Daviesbacteria bacterium]
MKRCYKCKETKALGEFYKLSRSKDGLQPICKVCDIAQTKASYRNNKKYYIDAARANRQKTVEFINKVKSNPCTDCGNIYHPVCMDFDHLEEKEKAVSLLKSRSIARITKEIIKCELVCSNCHRLRTLKRRVAFNMNEL